MRKFLTSAALHRRGHGRRLLFAGQASAAEKLVIAVVPKNLNNPFFDQAKLGCEKAVKEIGDGQGGVLLHRPRRARRRRRAGADRGRPDRQGRRRHRRFALRTRRRWRASSADAKAKGIPVLTWDSDLLPENTGPARRLYRHAQLRHRRQPREARAEDQAERRHDLHPVGRRRGGQPQRAHAGHPRHARRHDRHDVARRSPDRPERLDRSRRLPALHQRRLPAVGAADGRHPRQVSGPRRLHADRRLPAVRA